MSKKLLICMAIALVAYGCPKQEPESSQPPRADLEGEVADDSDQGSSDTDDGDAGDGDAEPQSGGPSTDRPQMCSIVSMADLSGITGKTYDSTNSQADYANITHCEYRNDTTFDIVSVVYATGDTATSRMQQAQMFQPKGVEGFLDEAAWEPARGVFSAISGDEFVEVTISKSHGDDDARIGLAKKLVTRVLEVM